ncbi:hypothetical protein LSH36_1860g00013 [Paralvinella palmiformis]|uniref:Apple domain-containing protein n=1 Tax=Paralvinella palmiformis TaxID=53620 RepID=A0AAD9IR60_9ANNE|nr:hypothetical protein LSH36_1860g00013 [Paralvinella palmiformis]
MSFLDGLLFFFIIPWTPIVGGQKVNTRLSPVKNRPPDNDQIFDIQTPTDSQCIYNCMQNGKCLAVVYDKGRHLCNGYRSITANQSLTQEQQAWHIIYKAALVGIMNVVVRMMEYWHQVKMLTFRLPVILEMVEVCHRCNINAQAAKMELSFSNGFSTLVSM